MNDTNYVQEIRPDDPPPSCHACGCVMVPTEWKCLSCGTTTGISPAGTGQPDVLHKDVEELAREITRTVWKEIDCDGHWRTTQNAAVANVAALLRARGERPELTVEIVSAAEEAAGYLSTCDGSNAKDIGAKLDAALKLALPTPPREGEGGV